ncbi:MAG: hypothetical protein JWQ86_6410 [Mycobacterium sp.]|jgi:hypothetical protein|nr:hypothetical protein [Mycobacterium sp.]
MRCRDFGARLVTLECLPACRLNPERSHRPNSSPIGMTGDAWVSRGTAFVTGSELYPTVTDSNLTFMHEIDPGHVEWGSGRATIRTCVEYHQTRIRWSRVPARAGRVCAEMVGMCSPRWSDRATDAQRSLHSTDYVVAMRGTRGAARRAAPVTGQKLLVKQPLCKTRV